MSSPTRRGCAATRTVAPRADAPRSTRRPAFELASAALLLFAAGCSWMPGVLSDEERKRVENHEQMSLAYAEVGDYVDAEAQCRRGLELDGSDHVLKRRLAYALLMQGTVKRLEEAEQLFGDEAGLFGGDDWRVRLGRGMTLQQLAHAKSLAKEPAEQAKAPELRQRARAELAAAEEGSAKDKTTPAELHYQLALLDLEDDRLDLFQAHAKTALQNLKQSALFLDKERAQTADPHAKARVEYDLAVNRERGRRIAQEAAGVAWNQKDVKGAVAALETLEAFGPLERADFYNRAHMREEVGDLAGAEKDYDQFLKASAGKPDENVTRAIESLTRLRARLAEQRTQSQLATGR